MKSSKHAETCFVGTNNDFDDKLTAFWMKNNVWTKIQKNGHCGSSRLPNWPKQISLLSIVQIVFIKDQLFSWNIYLCILLLNSRWIIWRGISYQPNNQVIFNRKSCWSFNNFNNQWHRGPYYYCTKSLYRSREGMCLQ